MKKAILFLILCASSGFTYPRLLTGTYQLSGSTTKWDGGAYQGEVSITQQGENYSVIWRIGSMQKQVGIGILYKDTLSVAFRDISSGNFGIATYRLVADGELEGRWTNYDSRSQKPEYLIWKY